MHRFKIVPAKDRQFRVQFVYNSEIIFWSENYKAKATAKNCIQSLKKNAPGAAIADLSEKQTGSGYRFEIVAGKKEGFFVRFVARNGETMMITENYTAKKSAMNAIDSVKKNGPAANVSDEAAAKPKTVAAKAPAKPTVKQAAAKPAAKKPAAKPAAKAAAPKPATKAAAAKKPAAKPAAKAAAKPAAKAVAKPAAKKPAAKAAAPKKPAVKAAAKPAAKATAKPKGK